MKNLFKPLILIIFSITLTQTAIASSSALRSSSKILLNTLKLSTPTLPTYNQIPFNTIVRPMSRLRERPPVMTVTESAAERISALLGQKPDKNGIIIGVRQRGCNGNSYTLNYIDQEAPKGAELVTTSLGDKVYVDGKALLKIIGTEMDFVENELASEFVFNNPNVTGKCGCGESFNF